MNKDSRAIKYIIGIIILILISFNVIQTRAYPMGKVVETPTIICNSNTERLDFSKTVSALNESNYLISGKTGEVSNPTTVCLSNNEIVILWREEKSILKIAKFDSMLNYIIDANILVDGSLLTSDQFELSQPKMLIDSKDNLHIFWYFLGFDYPQTGDIYYLKLNANMQVIMQSKAIHTYTHSGNISSAGTIINEILLDIRDEIHILVADNTYYLLNNESDVKVSTIIPEELGEVQDLLVGSDGEVFIICQNDDSKSISSIKYTIEETTIIEQNRNLLFETSEKIVHYMRLQKIDANLYFYWRWEDKTNYSPHYESYLINSNGSLGEFRLLNEHFFTEEIAYVNSTHVASLKVNLPIFDTSELYFSLFNPTQNQSYIETKLLIRFIKDENNFYGPRIFGTRIIPDKESEFIITWYVNDGENGFQVFLWKCAFNGTIMAPLILVAPIQSQGTNYTMIFVFLGLTILPLIIIVIALPRFLKQKNSHTKEQL